MNTTKIMIVGTGYTGKELTRKALASNVAVAGTTRDDDTIKFLSDLDASSYRWSIDDESIPWANELGPSTTVLYSLPTLFRSYQASSDVSLPRHVLPVRDVVNLCKERGVDRFIYLSSTSVYGDHGGEWVDEHTPLRPTSPVGKMRSDIESFLMQESNDFPITIGRLVGIYGPGRTLLDYIQQGRYTVVSDSKKTTNRIHVHDIARAMLTIIEKAPRESRIYNITDGHPQTVRTLIEFICTETGIDAPPEETLKEYALRKGPNSLARWKNSIRVRNDRLRQELDFQLDYPDVFSGYKAILSETITTQ